MLSTTALANALLQRSLIGDLAWLRRARSEDTAAFDRSAAAEDWTIATNAAYNGHLPVLRWVLSVPELGAALLKTATQDGGTIADLAKAKSHKHILGWIAETPDLSALLPSKPSFFPFSLWTWRKNATPPTPSVEISDTA